MLGGEKEKMENKKNLTKLITVVAIVLSVLAVAMVGAASAKSLYVISDINSAPTPIQSYDIQAAPTYLVYQTTNTVPYHGWGGVGLAIDTDSAMLFVTYEQSNTIQLKNATTMANEGTTTAPGANNLAGIVVDQDKSKVYTMDRRTNKLYVYSWDASTKTLTLDGGTHKSLPSCVRAYGIALDEVNDMLYVGDDTTSVKYYSTNDWTTLAGQFTVSHDATGIAIDVANQYVYTGSGGPSGGTLLSKYDLSASSESTVNVGSTVLGLAVDNSTGLVHLTTYGGGTKPDRLIVYDSSLTQKWISGDIGNPTGLCVPGKDISYNPLNFSKVDDVANCVNPGDTYTYTLKYKNTNPSGVTGVTIVDTLPSEVSFVSCSNSCDQTGLPTTVSWTIGNLNPGQSGSVTLTVKVKPGIAAGTKINNSAVINGNEVNTGPTTKTEQTDVCSAGGGNCCACPTGSDPGDPCVCMQAADQNDCENIFNGTWVGPDGCVPGTTTGCEGLYCQDGQCIPEFSTIALPVASILGLLFYFNYRKRKREQ